ncbi:MAG: hypothetical protein PVH68_06250 [Armatimonadota bacterium]
MRDHAAPLALIVVVAGAIFVNALRSQFIWDDYPVIVHNDHIQDLRRALRFFGLSYWQTLYEEDRGLRGRAYRPVIELSFAVEYAIWRLNPVGWHITSVSWHTINCVLLYFFVLGILKDRLGATLCALLFATHPIHIEAVVWAKARSELLAFMLMLASAFLYLRSLDAETRVRWRIAAYLCGILAFALALLSKASAVVLPALLALYVLCFLPRQRWRAPLLALIPFVGAVAAFVALDSLVPAMALTVRYEPYSSEHLLIVLGTVGRYLKLLLLPVGLCLHPRYPTAGSLLEPDPLLGLAFSVVLLAGTVIAFFRSRVAFFALVWLLIGLAPISNLKFLPRLVGEGRAYLASVGFCLLVALLIGGIRHLPRMRWRRPSRRTLAMALGACVVLSYAGLTVRRNMDWRDNYTLWTDTIEKNPTCVDGHRHLAKYYIEAGRRTEAIPHLQAAATVVYEYPRAVTQLAQMCADEDLPYEAMRLYEMALGMAPDDVEARVGLGTLYLSQRRAALRPEPCPRASPARLRPPAPGAIRGGHCPVRRGGAPGCGRVRDTSRPWHRVRPDGSPPGGRAGVPQSGAGRAGAGTELGGDGAVLRSPERRAGRRRVLQAVPGGERTHGRSGPRRPGAPGAGRGPSDTSVSRGAST